MTAVLGPYGQSLALLTDLYELTMAYGYWKSGMAEREAVFNLYFRKHPFGGDHTVAAGLAPLVDFVRGFHFDESDLEYLHSLHGAVLTAEGGPIEVGPRCVIMENAVLRGTKRHPLRLGADVLVGPRAYLTGCAVEDCAASWVVSATLPSISESAARASSRARWACCASRWNSRASCRRMWPARLR